MQSDDRLICTTFVTFQGWWHYAVALDASITVMQNFYHAPTNAAGMVQMVLKSVASLRSAAQTSSRQGTAA